MRCNNVRGKAYQKRLSCSCCNYIATIFRRISKDKEIGHIKHMYCPICRTEQAFIEQAELTKKVACYF